MPNISIKCKEGNHESDFTTDNKCNDKKCKCNCHNQASSIPTRQDIENWLIQQSYESDY